MPAGAWVSLIPASAGFNFLLIVGGKDMYFLSEHDGTVTTIQCAISGKYWRYHSGSATARKQAIEAAISFQKALIGTLVNDEHLGSNFYTLTELEAAYARHDAKQANVQGDVTPRRWIA